MKSLKSLAVLLAVVIMVLVVVLLTREFAARAPRADGIESVEQQTVNALRDELMEPVERATGLRFKTEPAVAVRSREQVQAYLLNRLAETVPVEDLEGFQESLKLFGLIPDSLDLSRLLVDLYTEQVVGFYDPDSTTLYVVDHTDPLQLKLVMAHELVHSLQDQYTNVDSLISISRETDRAAASQAVLEGQATISSLLALMPTQDINDFPASFGDQARELIRQERDAMPVFSAAPLILKEQAIFPYLAGADWIRWFGQEYPDTVPLGRLMPTSTEQIMHPEKFLEGDEPVDLRFVDEDQARYADGFGEFSTKILLHQLSGREAVGSAAAQGWDGDRFAIFETGDTHGLVWWTIWDTDDQARRFATILEREWGARNTGRLFSIQKTVVENRAAVRLVDGPRDWAMFDSPPAVRFVRPGGGAL